MDYEINICLKNMEADGQIRNEKISKEENENVGVCNAQWEGSLVTPL